ncbi:hypothetical protein ACU4GD_19720 [Cupriavidus basilensis]
MSRVGGDRTAGALPRWRPSSEAGKVTEIAEREKAIVIAAKSEAQSRGAGPRQRGAG